MKNKTLPILFAVFSVFPAIVFGQDNEKLIKDYISQNKIREYKKSDLNNFIVDNVDPSKSLNGNVVKFLQTYKGLPIYNSVGTVLVKDSKIVYYTDNFVKDYTVAASGNVAVSKTAALHTIAQDLKKNEIKDFLIRDFSGESAGNKKVAKQRLVYVDDKGSLKLAYEYLLREPKSPSYWNYLIDTNTGKIIEKTDLNLSCSFHPGAYSHSHTETELIQNKQMGPLNNFTQFTPFLAPDNASYNVFPLPVEAPTFGSRQVISNPWNLTASPEGWHSDGENHYTITRGNNVYAYEDTGDVDAGLSPDGGAARNFNFPFSINGTPAANQNASITNLFYLNNKIHDVFYKFGFTESAKNFQKNNFGLGGLGEDYVEAEGQDGGGLNNANFGTPPDGNNPYMQMYLWSPVNQMFFYNTPGAAVVRTPINGTAEFGPALTATGVTANVQLSSDIFACTALPAGSLTGKIGLIERGGGTNCGFAVKAKNAQDAGAVGVVIYNNAAAANFPWGMGGTDPSITIPTISIENSEGEYIKTQLAANTTVNITLKNDPVTSITPDGSFDNGIVTHEYGHGISNRLTGTGAGCLSTSASREQMGEGWSDFFALMLTNRPGDNATVARGMGTYAGGEPITGGGIRPAKYSPDFSVNPFTYGVTNQLHQTNPNGTVSTDSHSIGFIWATMLWDLHWKYVEKYGYSSDVMSATPNGSTKVLQLVVDALKLQGCNPSFIDGRNAILSADMATTNGQDRCMIWKVFAKRGLGAGASAGVKSIGTDQVEDFNIPEDCASLGTDEVTSMKDNKVSIYPNPARDEFYIDFPSKTLGKVSVELYDMSGKLVSSEDKISPENKKAISTSRLINGTYIVKVKGLGFEANSKVIVKK
ncbi:T9SS-dependent M36 family metallopeptidase [Chryseobacterium sp.]|uniref:T9SS-dependent M36 family metallopeptidase n=1 Tax=Chryseobacterium sp. TaxID=1871047 RepID=UPI0032198412